MICCAKYQLCKPHKCMQIKLAGKKEKGTKISFLLNLKLVFTLISRNLEHFSTIINVFGSFMRLWEIIKLLLFHSVVEE